MHPNTKSNKPIASQMLGPGSLTMAWALLLMSALGCDAVSDSLHGPGFLRQLLPATRTDAGLTGRSALTLPAGFCVIQHFPPVPDEKAPIPGGRQLTEQEIEDGKTKMRLLPYGNCTTFNCATFALADELDLEPTDWIEPIARSSTFFTEPAQVVLDSLYAPVLEFQLQEQNWRELPHLERLQDGDVICYRTMLDGRLILVHMGRLKRAGGEFVVLSKFGIGPIVETSIEYCAETFGGDYIAIYRPKSELAGAASHTLTHASVN